LRKLAALCIVLRIKLYVRWLPSELNAGDRPSRLADGDSGKIDYTKVLDDLDPVSGDKLLKSFADAQLGLQDSPIDEAHAICGESLYKASPLGCNDVGESLYTGPAAEMPCSFSTHRNCSSISSNFV